jgi:hypothetical protein
VPDELDRKLLHGPALGVFAQCEDRLECEREALHDRRGNRPHGDPVERAS